MCCFLQGSALGVDGHGGGTGEVGGGGGGWLLGWLEVAVEG